MKQPPLSNFTKISCSTLFCCLYVILFISAQADTIIQITQPRITNLTTETGIDGKRSFTVETTVPLDLAKEPLVLSNPNRIIIDFTGAAPGHLLMSSCLHASSPEITIRCGRHFDFTRMVLDFGNNTIPEFHTSQQDGNFTLVLVITPSIPGGEIEQLEKDPFKQKEVDGKDAQKPEVPPQMIDDLEYVEDDNSGRSFHINGYFSNRLFHDTHQDNNCESNALNHFKAITNLTYDNNSNLSAQLGFIFNMYSNENHGNWEMDSDLRFHETYVNLLFAAGNLRVGNQIVRWGKTDGFSPLDNTNPEDFRAGIAGRREERKLPIPMVNIEYDLFRTTFQGIYIPGFFKSDLDIVGNDWSPFGHLSPTMSTFSYQQEEHNQLFDNPEYGVRASTTLGGMDFSLSYLNAKRDTPVVGTLSVPPGFPGVSEKGSIRDLVQFGVATNQAIPLRYPRQNIFGLEFETTYSNFGIRGDIAYFDKNNYLNNQLLAVKKPVIHYVLGADYLSATDFYINLQFSHSMILDFEEELLYQEEHTKAIIATVSQILFNGDLQLELRSYYDLSGDAAMYNPRVIIKKWDNLTFETGAELFFGKPYTIFGMFEDNDQLYGEVSYSF